MNNLSFVTSRVAKHLATSALLFLGASNFVNASNAPLNQLHQQNDFVMTVSLEQNSSSSNSQANKGYSSIAASPATPATSVAPASDPTIEDGADRSVVIGITGPISKNTVAQLKQALPKVKGDPVPAGLIVLLDSAGGDGMAAMEIGRLLRKANAHTFVTGQCASACILVLASGVVRAAPAYSIGIHRGRITLSDNNAKILKEIDVDSNPAAKRLLERFEQTLPVYFAEMGMPPDLFQAMQSHQYKGVYRLNSQEIVFYGLSGFDSEYLSKRAQLFEEMKGPYHMDKDELHRRTLKVASRCAEFDQQHTAFIQCYKKVLKDPYLN